MAVAVTLAAHTTIAAACKASDVLRAIRSVAAALVFACIGFAVKVDAARAAVDLLAVEAVLFDFDFHSALVA